MDKILALPYPNFQLKQTIDPDQFDANYQVLLDKIDESFSLSTIWRQ
jgi:hypothetical protein